MSELSYKTEKWSVTSTFKSSPWIISFMLFGLSFCVCYLLIPTFSLFYEVASPSGWGTAVFYSEPTLVGERSLVLYVRDYSKSGRDIIPVDYLVLEGRFFDNARWSKDGSVIVANVGKGDTFLRGDEENWIGYDFKNHIVVRPPDSNLALVRGKGLGKMVFPHDKGWLEVAHHPWPWQIIR